MKKYILWGLALILLSIPLFIGTSILRPCGHVRLEIYNSWSYPLEVVIYDDGPQKHLLWEGIIEDFQPVKVRTPIDGDTAFDIKVKNLETGEELSGLFGYDTIPSGNKHLFLIDYDQISYHSWSIEPWYRELFVLGMDALSCIGTEYTMF